MRVGARWWYLVAEALEVGFLGVGWDERHLDVEGTQRQHCSTQRLVGGVLMGRGAADAPLATVSPTKSFHTRMSCDKCLMIVDGGA